MDNAQGKKIYYGIVLDNAQLRQDAEESKKIFRGIGDASTDSASRIDSAYKSVSGTLVKLGATLSAVELAKGIYNFADRFERSMAEVTTISETVTNDLGKFKQEIIEMSTEIPVPADEAAKALYQIVSAGHDGAAGMEVLRVSAKAAVGGVTETVTAADAITSVLNAYKKGTGEAEHISDQLFTTVRLGKTTMGELGHSISQAIPIAAAFGIESEQVLAAIATLTKSGTPTAQAVTQVRAAINAASKALGDGYFKTHTFQEGLQAIADKAGGSEAELRKNVTEIEAINAILGLTGINAKTAASDLDELMNSAGATEEAFRKMAGETSSQLTILKNNVLSQFSEMGESMVDHVGKVAAALNEAFDTGKIDTLISALGTLIAMYGTYKATLIATAAIRKSVETVKHTEQAAELYKLLTAEQQAKISKMGLSKTSAEYAKAVRMEVAAEMERQTTFAVATNAEIAAARVRLEAARNEKTVIAEKVAAREAELAAAVASGNAKKIEASQTRLNTAQEQLNTASVNVNTAAREVNSKRAQLDTAVRRANTLETGMNTAAQNANATATGFLSVAKERLRVATVKLNAVIKKNGFALAATAAAAFGYGLYKLITYQTDAEKAQSKLNDAIKASGKEINSEVHQIDAMFTRLKAAKQGTDEYRAAKEAIMNRYGEYLKELGDEKTALNDIAAAYTLITEEAKKAARARAMETFTKEAADTLVEKEGDVKDEVKKLLDKKYKDQKGADGVSLSETYYWKIKPVIEGEAEITDEIRNIIGAFDRTKLVPTGIVPGSDAPVYSMITVNDLQAQIDAAAKARDIYNRSMEQARTDFGENPATGDKGQTAFDAATASLQQLMTKLPQAQEQLAALKKAETPDPAAIAAKEQEIAEIKAKTLARERELSVIKDVKDHIETLQKEQLNYGKDDKEYKALDARIKALKTKLPGAGRTSDETSEYDKIILAAQERRAREEVELERRKIKDKAGLIEFERDQTIKGIEETRREAAKAWAVAGNDPDKFDNQFFDRFIEIVKEHATLDTTEIIAEQKRKEDEEFAAMLQTIRTYEQQRTAIAEEYAKKRKALYEADGKTLKEGVTQGNVDNLNRKMNQELADLDNAIGGSTGLWSSLFEDFAHKSRKSLMEIADNARQLLEYVNNTPVDNIEGKFGMSAEQLKTLKNDVSGFSDAYERLNRIEQAANSRNPFLALIKGVQNYRKSLERTAKAKSDLEKINGDPNADIEDVKKAEKAVKDAETASEKIKANLLAGVTDIGQKMSEVGAAFEQAGAALSNDTLADVGQALSLIGDTASKLASGDYLGAALGLFTSWAEAEGRHRKALEELHKSVIQYQSEYNALLHDAAMESSDSLFGERRLLDAKKYYAEAQKQQDLLNAKMGDLASGRVVTGHKKTGLFGWGKGKDVYGSLLSVYPELIDQNGKFNASVAEAILNTRKLDDNTAQMLTDLIRYSEQAEEAMDALNDIAGEVVGNMASTMTDAIFNAIETGADGWDAFQDSGADAIKALGKMMVQELIISNYLDKYSDDIAVMLGRGDKEGVMDLFGKIATEMPSIYEMAADATQQIFDAAEKAGYDMTSDAERQASQKSGITASQESVNEGNGRLTAIQGLAFDIREAVKTIAANKTQELTDIRQAVNAIAASKTQDLTKIEINTERLHTIDANVFGIREASNMLVANSARMLQHLAGIEDNTSRLHAMDDNLANIRNDLRTELSSLRHTVSDIALKGTKLKR